MIAVTVKRRPCRLRTVQTEYFFSYLSKSTNNPDIKMIDSLDFRHPLESSLRLFSGELIFGGAFYWKEFCVSKWVALDNKNSVSRNGLLWEKCTLPNKIYNKRYPSHTKALLWHWDSDRNKSKLYSLKLIEIPFYLMTFSWHWNHNSAWHGV